MVNARKAAIENFVRTAPGLDDRNPDHYGYCNNTECPRSSRVYYLFDEDVPANVSKLKDGTRGQRLISACSKKCADAKRKRRNELAQAPHRKAAKVSWCLVKNKKQSHIFFLTVVHYDAYPLAS